jgi:hypothetical protein
MKYAIVQPTSAPARTCGDERDNDISDRKKEIFDALLTISHYSKIHMYLKISAIDQEQKKILWSGLK